MRRWCLPALAALIAGNFAGPPAKVAYAVIGGVSGAGIAVGPIVGGWATTELWWRVVFAGEVVLVVFILAMTGKIADAKRHGPKPRLDNLGAVMSAWVSASSCSARCSRAPGAG